MNCRYTCIYIDIFGNIMKKIPKGMMDYVCQGEGAQKYVYKVVMGKSNHLIITENWKLKKNPLTFHLFVNIYNIHLFFEVRKMLMLTASSLLFLPSSLPYLPSLFLPSSLPYFLPSSFLPSVYHLFSYQLRLRIL